MKARALPKMVYGTGLHICEDLIERSLKQPLRGRVTQKVTVDTSKFVSAQCLNSNNGSPFPGPRPKSIGAQVMLPQRQQTVASGTFETLCGHFLSQ